MAPQEEAIGSRNGSDTCSDKTKVLHTDDGAPYVICESTEAFLNPTTPPGLQPQDVVHSHQSQHSRQHIHHHQQLNLDLGQRFITRENKTLLWIIKIVDTLLIAWWETLFFQAWQSIPLVLRRSLTFNAWNLYLPLHKKLLGRRTGMHPSQSQEYHALTTIMWWSRFLPISPRRMRFSLSQLHVCTPNIVQAHGVEYIDVNMDMDIEIPAIQKDHARVRGLFLHQTDTPTEHVLFWVYGGAYLAGDAVGNSSSADWIARQCQMDVFIPEFRLAPDGDLDDVLWDVCLAYQWLVASESSSSSSSSSSASSSLRKDPTKVFLVGVSSGAAICVRLMQIIAQQDRSAAAAAGKKQDKNENATLPSLPSYLPNMRGKMPKAAVLFAPYVDYTEPKKGSFRYYPRLDLIVNESVQEYGLPYLESFIPNGRRRDYSPVYTSMEGLPPLCVVVSEHEAVYDMTIELVNRARAQGVPVTLGVWKYMCHVFSFLWGFVPEAQISMDFVCQWILDKTDADAAATSIKQ
jgi:monoterpene epsilon-lactone hydrolase